VGCLIFFHTSHHSTIQKAKVEEAAVAPASGGSTVGAVGPPWKCFLGNLSYDIDDDQAKDFFKDCGTVTDLFWLQDKETQKFFGAGFITFDTPEAQVAAVAKAGQELLGRPVKIEFAKPKAGGNATPGKKEYPKKEMSEKPDGCVQIFCGNLSYDLDDDATKAFFKDCGEIKAIRWLTDRDSGDFKGCGFIEFYDEAAVEKAALLNGQDLLGRQIRIDYAKQREKTW
jgi:nucleolin